VDNRVHTDQKNQACPGLQQNHNRYKQGNCQLTAQTRHDPEHHPGQRSQSDGGQCLEITDSGQRNA